MHVQLPLDQMTIADKLEVMESLWADLSRRADDLPSPDWHKEVLFERRRLVEEGKLQFVDWEKAFGDLREEVRANPPT